MKKKTKLSIIIPTYNEEKTILEILRLVQKVELGKLGVTKEVVIVDDGSTDKTVLLLKSKKNSKLYDKLIVLSKNGGKGAAIRTGLKSASGDIVLIQDADLEYDPSDYGELVKPIINGKAKVVYGSRRLRKKNVQYAGLPYYLGGHLITIITNLLYGLKITDEPTCYKVFDIKILEKIQLKCERFEFCPEITAKIAKQKISIYEVPISYYPRSEKEGKKIRWTDGLEAIWVLLKYRFFD